MSIMASAMGSDEKAYQRDLAPVHGEHSYLPRKIDDNNMDGQLRSAAPSVRPPCFGLRAATSM